MLVVTLENTKRPALVLEMGSVIVFFFLFSIFLSNKMHAQCVFCHTDNPVYIAEGKTLEYNM